jgi:hypothetical protein
VKAKFLELILVYYTKSTFFEKAKFKLFFKGINTKTQKPFGLSYETFNKVAKGNKDWSFSSYDGLDVKQKNILKYFNKAKFGAERSVLIGLNGNGVPWKAWTPEKIANRNNNFMLDLLNEYSTDYAGIVVTDFPSAHFLLSIISVNNVSNLNYKVCYPF